MIKSNDSTEFEDGNVTFLDLTNKGLEKKTMRMVRYTGLGLK